MVTFTRPIDSVVELYTAASDEGGDGGWLGYVLPGAKPGLTSFGLAEALGGQLGSLLFASSAPTLTEAGAASLTHAVEELLVDGMRRFVWLARPDDVSPETTVAFGFEPNGAKLLTGARIALGPDPTTPTNLALDVVNGSAMALRGDAVALTAGSSGAAPVAWGGPAALSGGLIYTATIPCAGPQRGCMQIEQSIDRAALYAGLSWGIQIVIADSGSPSGYRTGWYPLATGSGDSIPLAVSVDPTDPFNATAPDRTAFAFQAPDGPAAPTTLASGYRTSSGWPVTLAPAITPIADRQPARLWLHGSPEDTTAKRDFVACPVGDFTLGVGGSAEATAPPTLLCGLAGTETIAFSAGDTMRFTAQQPAFASGYPYPAASPTLPPVQPLAPRLDRTFLASWASLITSAHDGGHYSAQPAGAALYAKPPANDAGVLLFTQPGITLAPAAPFPLLPYSLVGEAPGHTFSIAEYADVETKVIAAERRAQISTGGLERAAARSDAPTAPVVAERKLGGTAPATTPTGLVVQVDQATGEYAEVAFAQDVRRTPPVVMKLIEPVEPMHDALQTSQLFMVVTNADGLGSLAGWPPHSPAGPSFCNAMTIEGWALLANVGENQSYGDYGNVLIVKGRRGKLSDLIGRPDVWTQSRLAIPSGIDGDPAELAAVSRWLQDYLADARQQASDYFQGFNSIVEDESWTGVLVLKADIAEVPSELAGMLGGVEPEGFKAHHFGFTITKVDPATVAMSGNSATFGLIYYVDPAFDPARSPPQPVAPACQPWDFKVLTLKALFANAAVVRFESSAQLTVQQLFGQAVDHMGGAGANAYDALIMTGSLRRSAGVTSYGLEAEGDSSFFFDGGVFNKIELLQAEFSTAGSVPQKDGSTQVSARFDLSGFLDFETLKSDSGDFDLLSFGSESGETPYEGLSFSGLGVTMSFTEEPGGGRSTPEYAFDVSKIAFDPIRSTTRPQSLFPSLGLKVDSLLAGGADSTPSDLGYLDVATPLQLAGVTGEWYGLRLRVDFGTAGALAGKIGLTSYLLLAWNAPAGKGDGGLGLGLLLPGAGAGSGLLGLQGALELAIGPVALTLVSKAGGESAFMLVMNEIALKFLGILKLPPSGATAFYLFGDTSGGPPGWFALYDGPEPAASSPGPTAEIEA